MTASYSNRFQPTDAVQSYETGEYAVGSYSSRIWALQQPALEKILKDFRTTHCGPVRLLDFACGTGRVLSRLEKLVDSAEGVDISQNMVEVARHKCSKARLQVGDILTQPDLLQGRYDIISCFRFILNVEPALRQRVLKRLREVLATPDGLLLVNIHGSSRSLRHPAILWRRWRAARDQSDQSNEMLNEMSPAEARELLAGSGFKIVKQFGFGIFPPTFYRTPLRGLAHAGDRLLAGENIWKTWAIDMLFVCRPS